ncbi:GIY-YIG nuclease family protein [bacterium]|nr:GIY-YIG nuclease family protein [bacterium]
MSHKTITINFDGYWRDVNKNSIPNKSGIYCVYECTHNRDKENITIHKLIYIGEAGKVRDRILGHEKREKWLQYVGKGNVLCFSFGDIDNEADRERAEAAVINKEKPPVNEEYKNNFPFDSTTIKLTGEITLLHNNYTVE